MIKTKKDLEIEIKQLREKLERLQSKTRCYQCHGSGEIWTYFDGDTHCPNCGGGGFT
jgi:DnaJ-class molecular chaperone